MYHQSLKMLMILQTSSLFTVGLDV